MNDTREILRHWRERLPEDRLAHLVRDAGRALTRTLAARLATEGIAFGHWAFLRVLWGEDGLTQRELAERAGMTEPTTATALATMEREGWVSRGQQGGNRRKVYVTLTPAGQALRARLVPLAEQINEVAVRGASAAEIETVRRLLLRMLANLADDDM